MIVAAVQVRIASTRLPYKTLAKIGDRPILWHIVKRLSFARRIDRVVIATSNEATDAPIRDFAEMNGIPCFAGSELDLIDRLYQTARYFGASALVRITGDCPLADPHVVDQVVGTYLAQSDSVDYVTNTFPPTYPDGLDTEVYPLATLERLWKQIEDPFWREWFPSYVVKHKDVFRILNVAYTADLSALRWTLDYEEDLTFVKEVYRRLYRDGVVFGMQDVIALLEAEPELRNINARYTRNEGHVIAIEGYKRRKGGGKSR